MRYKLVAFDMDSTLLQGRSIFAIGKKIGRLGRIQGILRPRPIEATRRIASLLFGQPISKIEKLRGLKLAKGAKETLVYLKNKGYLVGIITNGYLTVARKVEQKTCRLDFIVANELEVEGGRIAGLYSPYKQNDTLWKGKALSELAQHYCISTGECVAVGDSEIDTGMFLKSGLSFAINPKNLKITERADFSIRRLSAIMKVL